MKVVFMGTPDFAVGTLEAIMEAGHEVLCVVTQPDKPKGRGKELQMPPVKVKALEYGLTVYQPLKVREESFLQLMRELQPEIAVVVAFGQLLPQSFLDIPTYGCINVHGSILPKYRGAAPIQWAVINGETETGVTIQQMDAGLDTGDILKIATIPLEAQETGGTLFEKLAVLGANLLVEVLEGLSKGEIKPVPQTGESTHVGKLDKNLGHLDFTRSALELERLIRGLNPWPSAFCILQGKTLKIWKAQILEETGDHEIPGTITDVGKTYFDIATGNGQLRVLELQMEGKKRMDTEAFLRGFLLSKGTLLG